MLIRVLRPRFPGCDDVCSGSCYRPLKHGLFVVGFSFIDGLLGLLVAVITVVPGMNPSLVILLQFVPQCEEGGEFDVAVERVWAGTAVTSWRSLCLPSELPVVWRTSNPRQACLLRQCNRSTSRQVPTTSARSSQMCLGGVCDHVLEHSPYVFRE